MRSRRRCRRKRAPGSRPMGGARAGGSRSSMPASSPTRTISATRPIAASSARPTSTARSRPAATATICSGTNLDDLADWRPGLQAAEQHRVRHPYVEAGIDKATVRALAQRLGLDDLAELPAAPCLSSRLETGLPVTAARLELVHAVERLIQRELAPRTVRCRLLLDGITIQLDPAALALVEDDARAGLRAAVDELLARHGHAPAALPALPHGQRVPPTRRPRGPPSRPCLTSPSTSSGGSGSASARRCCAPARRRSRSARRSRSRAPARCRCC